MARSWARRAGIAAAIGAGGLCGCNHAATTGPTFHVEGSVTMWDLPYHADSARFGPWEEAPVRGVTVNAIDAESGRTLARARTDEGGAFALDLEELPDAWFVRVHAIVQGESLTSEVLSEAGGRVGWALRSDEIAGDDVSSVALSTAPGSAINGALHIADTLSRLDRFLASAGVPLKAQERLRMWWSPVQSFPCGSCFIGSGVLLGGAPEDPDEYDDQIIMHEAWHFLSNAWGADSSPGGRHVGDPLVPTLAWGEGMATAMALMTSEDPLYVDFRESYVRIFEVEGGEDPRFWGTYASGVAGDVSEYLVAALLWDLFDGDDSDEAPYSVQVSPASIVRVLREWMLRQAHGGVGFAGLDLADFVVGLRCLDLVPEATLQAMLDHRRFPLDVGEVSCDRPWTYASTREEPTPPPPLTEPDAKQLFLRREGREVWLRHPASASHDFEVRVQVRGSGESVEQRVSCEGTPCLVASDFDDADVVIVTGEWERQEPFGFSLSGDQAQARLFGAHEQVQTTFGTVREYRSAADADAQETDE